MKKYTAQIRRNSDNKVAEMEFEDGFDLRKGTLIFAWSEGNFACDCNRAEFAGDVEDDEEPPCSRGQYSVNLVDEDGKIFYKEFE